MGALTFDQWQAHITQVVADEGQWVGLADENLVPLMDMPPVVSLSAPQARLASSSVEATFMWTEAVGAELVGDGLQVQDPVDLPTRFLVIARPGDRRAYTITHCVAHGQSEPSTVTVHGVDLTEMLAWWPAPSAPIAWVPNWQDFTTDASMIAYDTPRHLTWVEMGQKATNTTFREAAATNIRNRIQDSFDAVNEVMGWSQDPHAVVEYPTGVDRSPELMIRMADDYLWDTLSAPAMNAGVTITVDVWWPGDKPMRVRRRQGQDNQTALFEERSWPHPMLIVKATWQEGGTS